MPWHPVVRVDFLALGDNFALHSNLPHGLVPGWPQQRGRPSGCEIIPTRGATAASMLSRAMLAMSLIVTSVWDASVQPTFAWEPLR